MTNKPAKPINLFDIQANQKAIGQEKFMAAFQNILNHGGYAQGPECNELDKRLAEYSNTKYCVTCSNGTDALILALMAWGVKTGDAVFVPSFTFVATAEAAAFLGATPIFVDSHPETWNIDADDLKKAIEEVKKEGKLNLKAIISVDIFGAPVDYDVLHKIAKDNNMKLLSDAAQSYGATYKGKKIGDATLADMTTTSFYPTKPLGCYGDGGAVFCNTDEENTILKSCRVHGSNPEDKYDNSRLGMTARMSSFQGAVLLEKLKVFDQELVDRIRIGKFYSENIDKKYQTQKIWEGSTSAYAIYTILTDDRDEFMAHLRANGVPCNIYYPKCVHNQSAYSHANKRSLPVCENLENKVVSIPMHPYLTQEELDYIVSCVNNFKK